MMNTIYKTLFEVKLFHEYYLTDTRGKSVFYFDQQVDKMNFLLERFQKGLPSITDVLSFQVPAVLNPSLKNLHMKLLTTYSGFKIALEVKSKQLTDGTTIYKPVIEFPPEFFLFILLTKKGHNIDGFSNARIEGSVPSVYYFSNEQLLTPKVYPVLSNSIPDFKPLESYEQGELASFGENDVREFFKDVNGIDQWRPVKGIGYVNENDRFFVPRRFYFSFSFSDGITDAEFVLKDQAGNSVPLKDEKGKSVLAMKIRRSDPLQKVLIDTRPNSSGPDTLFSLPQTGNHNKISYSLQVNGNNGYSKKFNLVFFDDDKVTFNELWGAITIKPKASNPDFSVLDDDGNLKTRRSSTGALTGTPNFELRIKSRLTFWRYTNNKRRNLILSTSTNDFLVPVNGSLTTKFPRPITHEITLFKKESDNTFHYLPNPESDQFLKIERGRLFSDIFVPESKMFPVESS